MFGLGHYASLLGPTLARLVVKLLKDARGTPALLILLFGLLQLFFDVLLQSLIFR
jgi:hypothetical protein